MKYQSAYNISLFIFIMIILRIIFGIQQKWINKNDTTQKTTLKEIKKRKKMPKHKYFLIINGY